MGAPTDSNHARRRTVRRAGFGGLAVLLAAALVPTITGSGGSDQTGQGAALSSELTVGRPAGPRVPQTSDGKAPTIARVTRPWLTRPITLSITRTRLASGVKLTQWSTLDRRGPLRFHLITADLDTKGVHVNYAAAGRRIAHITPLSTVFRRDRAVAGVNGDFFDIGDTNAPLGTGLDRHRGLLHGRAYGWNSTFWIDADGVPQIGTLPVEVTSPQVPGLRIANLNSPFVYPDSVGLWTPAWGRLRGTSMTDGRAVTTKVIRIRGGKVAQISTRVPTEGLLRTRMLIGRGKVGVAALNGLKVGDPIRFRTRLEGNPRMAISGQSLLVDNGLIRANDDVAMHPRTAIGIDRDSGEVMLLVVDGRQSFSRGQTLVELADTMIALGADEALNLDGGGSSAMFVHPTGKQPRIANSPSDGRERPVANGVEILARP